MRCGQRVCSPPSPTRRLRNRTLSAGMPMRIGCRSGQSWRETTPSLSRRGFRRPIARSHHDRRAGAFRRCSPGRNGARPSEHASAKHALTIAELTMECHRCRHCVAQKASRPLDDALGSLTGRERGGVPLQRIIFDLDRVIPDSADLKTYLRGGLWRRGSGSRRRGGGVSGNPWRRRTGGKVRLT
jgi:hypothetical protein